MIPLYGRKWKVTKEPLDESERGEWKIGLKLNIQKTKIMASCPIISWPISSVQFSRSVMSDSLWPHKLQHARLLCPSPSPGVHSNSHPSSQWCHPAISSSVVPFSSCPQPLPASDSFPMSQLFAWGGQSRWGQNGNSDRLYFGGLQNHWRWWLQPWN